MEPVLRIADREYRKVDYGYFCVPFDKLGGLRISDLPCHSSLQLAEFPDIQPPDGAYSFYLQATNGGGPSDESQENLSLFWCVTLSEELPADINNSFLRKAKRLRRVFASLSEANTFPKLVVDESTHDNRHVLSLHSLTCFSLRTENLILCDLILPVRDLFNRLKGPEATIFICHASEDKPIAERLASFLDDAGIDIWYDRREIKVGDSIVQRISDGLERATHLAVLLSKASVQKAWVKKEFSAALMRQLQDKSIAVLPVRLDDCAIPAILNDIRFADCRNGVEIGFFDLVHSLGFSPNSVSEQHVR